LLFHAQPSLAKFGVTNQQEASFEIDVGSAQAGRFENPQACGSNEPQERSAVRCVQSSERWQARGGRQQIGDLLIGVDVGCESSMRWAEQTSGWNLCRWIKLLAVTRETAH